MVGTITVVNPPSTASDEVFAVSGPQQSSETDAWREVILQLDAYSDDTVTIVFEATRGANFTSDIAIDDVVIEATPACSQPIALSASNITTNSADVSFTDVTNSTYGYIAVYTDGATSDTLYPSTQSFSLSGLSPNTVYTLSIRTICDIAPNADTSDVATLSIATNLSLIHI